MFNPFDSITEQLIQKGECSKEAEQRKRQHLVVTLITWVTNCVISAFVFLLPPSFQSFFHRKTKHLLDQQKTATSYSQWHHTSAELDKMLHNDEWKDEEECSLYNYNLIRKRLDVLHAARTANDNKKLLYLARTTWTRNMGNIGNVNLYRHSHVGTKRLIEEYVNECLKVLDVLTLENNGLDDRYVLGMLLQTRKAIGRTALVLSGGGCFGMSHIGVLTTLVEQELLPKIVSGSSAGAIVASILCVQTAEQTLYTLKTLSDRTFDIFDCKDSPESTLQRLSRFLKYGTWFDSQYLQSTMRAFLGNITFRESYNRTGRILNITVSPESLHEQTSLLNYLTAPNVLVWSAVCASCSLPGVFPASPIYCKNLKTGETEVWNHTSVKYLDGSVDNDMPITRLSEMFNVDHIIACQVNPHVVPFLKMSVECVGGEVETEIGARIKRILSSAYDLWANEIMHYLELFAEAGLAPNLCTRLRSLFAQKYSGNVTILPKWKFNEMPKVLANPTPDFIFDALARGARATWPKVTFIKNQCSVEFGIDRAISVLRSRLIARKAAPEDAVALISRSNSQGKRQRSETISANEIKVSNFHPSSHTRRMSNDNQHVTLPIASSFATQPPSPVAYHKQPGYFAPRSKLPRSYSSKNPLRDINFFGGTDRRMLPRGSVGNLRRLANAEPRHHRRTSTCEMPHTKLLSSEEVSSMELKEGEVLIDQF